MKLADTIVLVGAINPKDKHHSTAIRYLNLVGSDEGTFVPLVCLIEFDLVMKGRDYTAVQRRSAFSWLSILIPETKIIANSTSSLKVAIDLQESGMSYFDSMVSALALEKNASVLTPDKMISQKTPTEW